MKKFLRPHFQSQPIRLITAALFVLAASLTFVQPVFADDPAPTPTPTAVETTDPAPETSPAPTQSEEEQLTPVEAQTSDSSTSCTTDPENSALPPCETTPEETASPAPESSPSDAATGTDEPAPVETQAAPEDAAEAPSDLEAVDTAESAADEPDAGSYPPEDEPVADGPAADEPVADGPTADEPVADGPAADEPVADGPAADEPDSDGPAADEPDSDGPAADDPTVDEEAGPVENETSSPVAEDGEETADDPEAAEIPAAEQQEMPQQDNTENLPASSPSDPWFVSGDTRYTFLPTGADCAGLDNCTISDTPIQDAIIAITGGLAPDDSTLYIEGGNFSDEILLQNLKSRLILSGSADGNETRLAGTVTVKDSSSLEFHSLSFNNTVVISNSDSILIQDGVLDADLTVNNSSLELIGTEINTSLTAVDSEVSIQSGSVNGSLHSRRSNVSTNSTSLKNTSVSASESTLVLHGSPADDSIALGEVSSSQVDILTGEGDDALSLQAASIQASTVTFDGGDGEDTITGPSADTAWMIDGQNTGSLPGVSFLDTEILQGSPDNEDTFIFTPSGELDGEVRGGDAGFDSLVIDGGSYETMTFTAFGPDAGTIDLDGRLLTYRGLEPLLVRDTDADHLNLYATAFNDFANLRDDNHTGEANTAGTMIFESFYGTFESIEFPVPDLSLTINLGTGTDSIAVESLDPLFTADLIIKDPESLVIDSSISVPGDLEFHAGAANPLTDLLTWSGSDVAGGITVEDGVTLTAGGDMVFLVNAGLDLTLSALTPVFQDIASRAGITIGDADLIADNIILTTSATTLKFSGTQVFEDELLNYLNGETLAAFDDAGATLIFEDAPDAPATIRIDSGTSSQNFLSAGFESGQTIKIIGSTLNDGDDYIIDTVTASMITLVEDDALQLETVPGGGAVIHQAFTDILPEDVPLQMVDRNGNPVTGAAAVTSGTLLDNVLRGFVTAGKILDILNLPFEVLLGETESTITIGSGATLTAANGITIDAVSTTDLGVNTPAVVLGAAYVQSDSTASVLVEQNAILNAGGDVRVNAEAQNTMLVELLTMRGFALTKAMKYLKVPGVSINFAYGQASSHASAVVESGASISGNNVDIHASNSDDFTVSAGSAQGPGTIAASAGIAISDTESISETRIAGTITATGDINLDTFAHRSRNKTSATAAVKVNPLMKYLQPHLNSMTTSLQSTLSNSSLIPSSLQSKLGSSSSSGSQTQALDIAAGVALVDSSNEAMSSIEANAVVSTEDNLTIHALAEDNFKVIATGSSSAGAKAVIGGAVALARFTNTAEACIGASAQVDAGELLDLHAEAVIPNQITVDEDLQAILDFDFDFPSLGDPSDPIAFYEDLDSDLIRLSQDLDVFSRIKPYLSTNLGVPDKIATTFVGASAAATGDDGKFAMSGSVDLLSVTNGASAWIGEGAQINTNPAIATIHQSVKVDADASVETINVVGIPSILTLIKMPSKSSGAAIGGSFSGIIYNNSAEAWIDDAVTINAEQDISVTADVKNFAVNIAESGANASKFAVTGVVSYNDFESTATAYIEDEVILEAGRDLLVSAKTDTLGVIIAGGMVKGGQAGIGATAVINLVNGTTSAFIGDHESYTPVVAGSIIAGRDLTVRAENIEKLFSISIAGALAGSSSSTPSTGDESSPQDSMGVDTSGSTSSDGSGAADGTQGSAGIGISGDVAINDINATTEAYIADVDTVDIGDALVIFADHEAMMLTVAGAVALELSKSSGGVAIAGSFTLNDIDRTVQAYTENTTITATDIMIKAHTQDKMISVTAGGAAAPRQGVLAVFGSANVNLIDTTTSARADEGSDLSASGDVEVDSEADLDLISVAGGFSLAEQVGIGAAADVGVFHIAVESLVAETAAITADGNVLITAASEEDIISVAASMVIATKALGIAGSGSSQNLNLDVTATVDGTIDTGGNLLIDAHDDYYLISVGGAAAFGKYASVGLSLANSNIHRSVRAGILEGADIAADGNGLAVSSPSTAISENGVLIHAGAEDQLLLISAGGAASKEVAVEASVVVDTMVSTVEAFIEKGAQVNTDLASASTSQSVHLDAAHDTKVISIAGSFVGAGKVGVGAAIDVEVLDRTVQAYIEDAAAGDTGAEVKARNNVILDASSSSDLLLISAGAAFGGYVEISGSVVVLDQDTSTQAWIGEKAVVYAEGNVRVSAASADTIISVAGNLGYGGNAIGISDITLMHTDTVEAWISADRVTAKAWRDEIPLHTGDWTSGAWDTEDYAGVAVSAVSMEDLLTISAAGQASGGNSTAGSIVVNILTETTSARIEEGVRINPSNSDAGSGQDVRIQASDQTKVLSIAGGITGGGNAGLGAGADVLVLTKVTEALLAADTEVYAAGNVFITAHSDEDLTSVSASLAVSSQAGVAGSAGVYILDLATTAAVLDGSSASDGARISALGNMLVSAEDRVEIDMIAGSVAGSSTAGIGASAGVIVIDKVTDAYIGKHSRVDVKGQGTAITVSDGLQSGTAADSGSAEIPDKGTDGSIIDEVRAANLEATAPGPMDSVDLSDESDSDDVDDPALTLQPTFSITTRDMNGLAVTAMSVDDIEVYSISAGASANVAVNVSGSVLVLNTATSAYINEGARINQNNSGASAAQDVLVAAGSSTYHMNVVASASVSGSVSVNPGAGITVFTVRTDAYIDDDVLASAENDIAVIAASSEDVVSIVASVAGSAGLGAGGSVSLIIIDSTTAVRIGLSSDLQITPAGSMVDAGGDILISASDDTKTFVVGGSLGIGFGTGGIGAGVVIHIIDKDTSAYLGNASTADAGGSGTGLPAVLDGGMTDSSTPFAVESEFHGVAVQARSGEDIFSVAAAGGIGQYFGLGGGVSVELIDSDTSAFLGNETEVNRDTTGPDPDQSVNVSAANRADVFAFAGGIGGGIAGIGGGVDVGIIQNDTTTTIGDGALVDAENDVDVNALSDKHVESIAISGAGGVAAFAGSVSVWTIGSDFDAGDALTPAEQDDGTGAGSDNDDFTDTTSNADSMAGNFSALLSNYDSGTPLGTHTAAAASRLNSDIPGSTGFYTSASSAVLDPATSGTTAFIADNAVINAGGSVALRALEQMNVEILAGSGAAGAVGIGGSVVVLNLRSDTDAYLEGDSDSDANDTGATVYAGSDSTDDVLVEAGLESEVDVFAFAGSAGLVSIGAQVVVIEDSSRQAAHLGEKALIPQTGGTVLVHAHSDRNVQGEAMGGGFGGVSVGASIVDITLSGSTKAYLDDSVSIGRTTGYEVQNVSILAEAEDTGIAKTTAVAAGILSGAGADSSVLISNSSLAITGTNTSIWARDTLKIRAFAWPRAYAEADGIAISVAGSVGVSIAEAEVDQDITARIGPDSYINASDLNVFARQPMQTGAGYTAKSDASGSSGGLLFGVSATESTAINTSTISASIGGNTGIGVSNLAWVRATSSSSQIAWVSGMTGGIVAVGANEADVLSGITLEAAIGSGVVFSGGTLKVSAIGYEALYADAVSGSGGVVSVGPKAADAATRSVSSTTASIGNSVTGTSLEAVTVEAEHTTDFNSRADSVNASLVGVSGAYAVNTIDAWVEASIGSDVDLELQRLTVTAANNLLKDWLPGDLFNVQSGSGGVVDAPAAKSLTTVTNDSVVSIGTGSRITGYEDAGSVGVLKFEATSSLSLYDKVKLDSGGAISIALAESKIHNSRNNTEVNIGNGVSLDSRSDILISALTDTDIQTSANAKTYGGAGAAEGTSLSRSIVTNTIDIAGNVSMLADADLYLTVGRDSSGTLNEFTIRANTDLWNKTAFPIETDPDADAVLEQDNSISIGGGSHLQAVGEMYLLAVKGNREVTGYGIGKDLYRQVLEELGQFFSDLVGGGDVSLEIKGGSSTDNSSTAILINGIVEVGIRNERFLFINSSGAIDTSRSSEGIEIALTQENLPNLIQERIDEITDLIEALEEHIDDDPSAYANPEIAMEIDELETERSDTQDIVSGLEDDVDDYEDEISAWENTISANNTHIGSWNDEIDDLEAQIADLDTDDDAAEIAQLEAQIDQREDWIEQAQTENVDLEGNIEANEEQIEHFEDYIQDLNDRIDEIDDRIIELQAQLIPDDASTADLQDLLAQYQAEKAMLEAQLSSLGGSSPEVTVIEITTDITARSSNITIQADSLAGTGELIAPGDTLIEIENESPYFLRTSTLTIPDEAGGHIFFNHVPVTNLADINLRNQGTASFTNITTSENTTPEITILNSYIPYGDERSPDIFVDNNIRNLKGLVSIKSTYGSVKVMNGVSVIATTIDIYAGRDIFIGYEDGFRNLAGDIQEHWSDVVEDAENGGHDTSSSLSPADLIDTGFASDHAIIAGNNIFISGEYLNVNGIIQSGIPTWSVTIPAGLDSEIAAYKAQYDAGLVVDRIYKELSINNDLENNPGQIAVFYDAEDNVLELIPTFVMGGYVELYGHIMNTAVGEIRVMDGYGTIDVDNQTGTVLRLNTLNTGSGIEGTLKITDTGRRTAVDTPLVTVVKHIGNDIQKYNNYTTGDLDLNNPVDTGTNSADTRYQPLEHQYYSWTMVDVASWEETRYYYRERWFGFTTKVKYSYGPITEYNRQPQSPIGSAVLRVLPGHDETYWYDRTYFRYNFPWTTDGNWDTDVNVIYVYIKDHQIWERDVVEAVYHSHNIAADNPIDIHFYGSDTGTLSINSPAGIIIDGAVTNTLGDTTITTDHAIRQGESEYALLTGQYVDLDAGTGIGGTTLPLRIEQVNSGVLNATTTSGDIWIDAPYGGLTYDEINTASGNATISADLSITGLDTGSLITGNLVTLEARHGEIGSAGLFTRINSGNTDTGGLIALAASDIFVREISGDLYLITASSLGGNVSLDSSGNIYDNNGVEIEDWRAKAALLTLWDDMLLLDDGALESAENTVTAYENLKKREYDTYWQYRGSEPDPSIPPTDFTISLNQEERAYFQNVLGWTENEIDDYEQQLSEEYESLHLLYGPEGNAYDPAWSYHVPRPAETSDPAALEEWNSLTEGYAWTLEQLENSLSAGLLKEVSDTELRIEDPNASGFDITLTAADGIGMDLPVLTIDITGRTWSQLSDDEKLALLTAERADLTFLSDSVVEIIQREDVDIAAAGVLNVPSAGDNVYIGSEFSIAIEQVFSDGSVRIKTQQGITNAAAAGLANITASDTILEAALLSIGADDAFIILDLESGSTITARAGDSIYIAELGEDLNVDTLFAVNDIVLETPGSILDANNDMLLNIRSGSLDLTAGDEIGAADNFLDIQLNLTGSLTALAENDIHIRSLDTLYIEDITVNTGDAVLIVHGDAHVNIITALAGDVDLTANGDANINLITAAGTVFITADENIVDVNDDELANVLALHVDLTSLNAGIGTAANPFDIDAASQVLSTVNAVASGSIVLNEVSGNMRVDSVASSSADVTLSAPGSILDANADSVVNIQGVNIDLVSTGGSIGAVSDDLEIDSSSPSAGIPTASANGSIFLTETGGGLGLTETSQFFAAAGDIRLTVMDVASASEEYMIITGSGSVSAPNGDVTLRSGDSLYLYQPDGVITAGNLFLYGDYGDADPGTGATIELVGQLHAGSIEVYGGPDEDALVYYSGLPGTILLDGAENGDTYTVTASTGSYLVNVYDSGASGGDLLTIYGTTGDDLVLMRAGENAFPASTAFVAFLHGNPVSDVERINYSPALEQLIVETVDGNDHIYLDDNWTDTFVRGGTGNDSFQVGQMYKTERDFLNANVALEDEFETTATTRGFLSNGTSFHTELDGSDGEDSFSVYHNTAPLDLLGGTGTDSFVLRKFALPGGGYVANAAVSFLDGDPDEKLAVFGTEAEDTFVINDTEILGCGQTINYALLGTIQIDAAEGDDSFHVLALRDDTTVELFGGLGSDTFHIGGDADAVFIETGTLPPQAGPHDLDTILGLLVLNGGSNPEFSVLALAEPVMLPGETNELASSGMVLDFTGSGAGSALDSMTVNTADLQAVLPGLGLSELEDLIGATLEITSGAGTARFWQIYSLLEDPLTLTTDLLLKNPASPLAGWSLPDAASSWTIYTGSTSVFVNEQSSQDSMVVFNDNSIDDSGSMSRTELTGLDMPEGISFRGMESVEILLGPGSDSFTVTGTASGTTTTIFGGGDKDRLFVTGGGGEASPLILYGDAPEDRGRYTSMPGLIRPGEAYVFSNSAADIIDASKSQDGIFAYGGPGKDSITGSQGDDLLEGNQNDDEIYGEDGDDLIGGGTGSDYIAGGRGEDTVYGGSGNDYIYGESGGDRLYGEDGDDILDGGSGADLLDGSDGNDLLYGAPGNDWLLGGPGSDVLLGGDSDDVLYGGGGPDKLEGNAGRDRLYGGDGADILDGSEDTDILFGGDGPDELYGGADRDILFGNSGDDTLRGGTGNDVINGDSGSDTLYGEGGDDSLRGGGGPDMLYGGTGNDTLLGGPGADYLYGSSGNDVLFGGDGNDLLLGGFGNDVLFGEAGDDTLFGDADDDILDGGEGYDLLFGGQGMDQCNNGEVVAGCECLTCLEETLLQTLEEIEELLPEEVQIPVTGEKLPEESWLNRWLPLLIALGLFASILAAWLLLKARRKPQPAD